MNEFEKLQILLQLAGKENMASSVNSIENLIAKNDNDQFIKIIKKVKKQIISNQKSYEDLYQLVNSIDSF